MTLDPAKFAQGVASAAQRRDGPDDTPCDAGILVAHTRISSSR